MKPPRPSRLQDCPNLIAKMLIQTGEGLDILGNNTIKFTSIPPIQV